MQMRSRITFPTLVLSVIVLLLASQPLTVLAANPTPSPDFNDTPPENAPPTSQQKEFSESTYISPQPPGSPGEARRLGYFHKYRQGLSLMGAGVFDTKAFQDAQPILVRSSLLYLFTDDELRSYEVGFDLLSDNSGSISFARRFIFDRSRFRPYTKAGVAVRVDPNDQLATFLRLQHYRIFGTAGFELSISGPISLRLESGAGISARSFEFSLGAGLSWSF